MKQSCFSGFCCMKCKKWGWLPMTHIESLGTKIKIINYAALCKRQRVLKLPLYSRRPHPIPTAATRGKPLAAVLEGFCGFEQHNRNLLEKLSLVRRKGLQGGGGRPCSCRWPRGAMVHVNSCQLPRCWTGCTGALVKFFSSSGPYTSQPVVPAVHARLRLPSRFRKLLGLTFISANWMECSWPFQWNQLTP